MEQKVKIKAENNEKKGGKILVGYGTTISTRGWGKET